MYSCIPTSAREDAYSAVFRRLRRCSTALAARVLTRCSEYTARPRLPRRPLGVFLTQVHDLDSPNDYRMLKHLARAGRTYMTPLGPDTDEAMDEFFGLLTKGRGTKPLTLQLRGRKLKVERAARKVDVARFGFDELCGKPLGAEVGQTDRQTDRHRQTGRQTDKHTADRQTDRQTLRRQTDGPMTARSRTSAPTPARTISASPPPSTRSLSSRCRSSASMTSTESADSSPSSTRSTRSECVASSLCGRSPPPPSPPPRSPRRLHRPALRCHRRHLRRRHRRARPRPARHLHRRPPPPPPFPPGPARHLGRGSHGDAVRRR